MINIYKNAYSPTSQKEIDIYEAMEMIKDPSNDIQEKIKNARKFYDSDKELYNKIKLSLPCFTFNFLFNNYKKTENIVRPTGLLYLDIDGNVDIDLSNPYIFASWKSISGKGRGVLVLVDNLTEDNLKLNYKLISDELDVVTDINAAKATQYCINSFDSELYFNENSIIWICKEDFKNYPKQSYPSFNINKRKYSNEMGRNKIRFNNINSYDFKGKSYIYFENEKEHISTVNIPPLIETGGRNSILHAIAYQIKALNNDVDYSDLYNIIHYVNRKKCIPKLSKSEVDIIINKIDKLNNPKPMFNEERRFIFNPDFNLSKEEKHKIMNPILGLRRQKKSISEIKNCLDNWNIEKYGKITQVSLSKAIGKDIKTIQRYYRLFDLEIFYINDKIKRKEKNKINFSQNSTKNIRKNRPYLPCTIK